MSIVVLIPVLGRPNSVGILLNNLYASEKEVELEPLFIASSSDHAELRALDECQAPYLIADWEPGHADFQRKIQLGYENTDEAWIFQGADDVTFEAGWADHAVRLAEQTGALVVGTQDGGNPVVKKGHHSTHTLIARSYCDDPGASMDGPGTVFSMAYSHQWVDTELVEVAKARGVWAFCHEARVTHHHPMWSRANQLDDTYRKGLADHRADHQTFLQRQPLWDAQASSRRRRNRV